MPALTLFADDGVCPFCAIHCEDVDGRNDVDCDRRTDSMDRVSHQSSRIGEQTASIKDVTDFWNRQSVDLDKWAIEAGQIGGALAKRLTTWCTDHGVALTAAAEPTMDAMRQTILRDGNVTASLEEVRRLADCVWLLGKCESDFPRLSRWMHPDATVRRIESVTSSNIAAWMQTTPDDLDDCRYFAIVIGRGGLGNETSDPIVASERIIRWIWTLNRETQDNHAVRRAVAVTIDPLATIRDVYRSATNRSLRSSGAADSTIRVGTPVFADPLEPPVCLQIGGVDYGKSFAQTFISTDVAGWHCRDIVIRGDGTVTLPTIGKQPSKNVDAIATLDNVTQLVRSRLKPI